MHQVLCHSTVEYVFVSHIQSSSFFFCLCLTDLSFFAKTLELYHGKYKEAIAIQDKMHLGLLLVDQSQLKQQLNASTLSSLEVRTTLMDIETFDPTAM